MTNFERADVLVENAGEWILKPKPCVHGGLPEKLASAFGELFSQIAGACYTPLVYCGHQLVNGTNYMIICKVKYMTSTPKTAAAKVILHETQPCCGLFGTFSILSIETIAEEAQVGGYILDPFAYMPGELSKDPIHDAFKEALEGLCGSEIRPLAYCGKQSPSPGNTNLMFICSSRILNADTVSHIDIVTLTKQTEKWKLANITPIV